MPLFKFTYQPENLALADKPKWVSATDGDTPSIETPVRMLGIDAPELHFGGASETNPGKYDAGFKTFLQKTGKPLPAGLKKHLEKALAGNGCTRHIEAGKVAYGHFEKISAERLERGNGANGQPLTRRRLFVMASNEVFDKYGRFLCYLNASYTKAERDALPAVRRPTFNLQMVRDGHAATLLIYPNVPRPDDLALVQKHAGEARKGKRGFWKNESKALLAYEFRWIIDTIEGRRTGPDRFCGDLSSGLLYAPSAYYRVLPEDRLFFRPADVGSAIGMGFSMAT